MWVLMLNDMRAPKVQMLQPVARAESREALIGFLERERVADYHDERWGKAYRAGGPLEWFNPPWDYEENRHFINVGTASDAALNASAEWERQILPLPSVDADAPAANKDRR